MISPPREGDSEPPGRSPDAQGLGLEDANLFKDLMVELPHARAEALSLGLEELAHGWVC